MTEYVEDAGLTDAFKTVFNNKTYHEFQPLRENKVRVLPLMRVKTNKDGEHQPSKGAPAVLKKVPDIMKAAGVEADFILVVDYYAWNHPKGINPQMAQEAYLHHALMTVEVEKVEDDKGQDKVKTASRSPDVEEFIATAQRYGGYDDDQVTFGSMVLKGAEAMKQIANGSLEETQPHVEAGTPEEEAAPETPEQGEEPQEEAPAPRRRGRTK